MKIVPKLSVLLLFCLMWQNSHSQLLYPEYKKDEYLPPPCNSNVTIVSPDVEKWLNTQLTKGSKKRTVKMKTDVMGRARTSFNGIEQEMVVENKEKRLVVISDKHIPQIEIEPVQGRYEYNSQTKNYDYYLNGEKINSKEYEFFLKRYNEKFDSKNKGKRNLPIPGVISSDDRNWIALMTAEEINTLINNYEELVIDDYIEPMSDASVASILSTIQLSTHAFPNGYQGNAIGVGVVEVNCRSPSVPIINLSRYTNNCTGTTDSHHSRVVNVVQSSAPLAHVFGFRSSSPHPNPSSFSPPIEVVTHSYSQYPSSNTAHVYSRSDMDMDNYIYQRRVINFKSAGNRREYHPQNCVPASCDTTFYVASPGKALNVITVGAVEPATNRYAPYSKWRNSEVNNEKPELSMYTDIDMGIFGFISGTSASTPLAAGFTATLLEQHPFFKRRPALMKAVLLTGETIPIQNANSWDLDNYKTGKSIMNYSSVAWGTRSWFCEGGNSACFNANNNREIHITENNIQANKRYRIAISWLTEGNFVSRNKRTSQDLDMYVYQNGQLIASSASWNDPFEIVDFVTRSSDPLNIVIRRFRNDGGNVVLGYHMRTNL
ncbi:MAG: S8 family peptidase [Fibromonadaceae bacterium]|nr:S8 family peptidase [Fibromonadaceae bacterium]